MPTQVQLDLAARCAAYLAPPMEMATPVLWYKYGKISDDPIPAMVTHIAKQTLDLVVFRRSYNVGLHVENVRHVSDPHLENEHNRASGAWEYRNQDKPYYYRMTERLVKDREEEKAALDKKHADILALVSAGTKEKSLVQ